MAPTKTAKRSVKRVGSVEPDMEDIDGEDVNPEMDMYDDLKSAMRAELAEDADKENLELKVPARPKMRVIYHPVIDYDDYQVWLKKASRRKKGGSGESDLNQLTLALILLSNTCVGIQYLNPRTHQYETQYDREGDAITLANAELHDMLKVPSGSTAAAIRKLYGNDGDIIKTLLRVSQEAGYTVNSDEDEDDESGPLDV